MVLRLSLVALAVLFPEHEAGQPGLLREERHQRLLVEHAAPQVVASLARGLARIHRDAPVVA